MLCLHFVNRFADLKDSVWLCFVGGNGGVGLETTSIWCRRGRGFSIWRRGFLRRILPLPSDQRAARLFQAFHRRSQGVPVLPQVLHWTQRRKDRSTVVLLTYFICCWLLVLVDSNIILSLTDCHDSRAFKVHGKFCFVIRCFVFMTE